MGLVMGLVVRRVLLRLAIAAALPARRCLGRRPPRRRRRRRLQGGQQHRHRQGLGQQRAVVHRRAGVERCCRRQGVAARRCGVADQLPERGTPLLRLRCRGQRLRVAGLHHAGGVLRRAGGLAGLRRGRGLRHLGRASGVGRGRGLGQPGQQGLQRLHGGQRALRSAHGVERRGRVHGTVLRAAVQRVVMRPPAPAPGPAAPGAGRRG